MVKLELLYQQAAMRSVAPESAFCSARTSVVLDAHV